MADSPAQGALQAASQSPAVATRPWLPATMGAHEGSTGPWREEHWPVMGEHRCVMGEHRRSTPRPAVPRRPCVSREPPSPLIADSFDPDKNYDFQPMGNLLLVHLHAQEKVTKGGIILAANAVPKPNLATVIAAGLGQRSGLNGIRIPPDCEVGDVIIVQPSHCLLPACALSAPRLVRESRMPAARHPPRTDVPAPADREPLRVGGR